VNMHGRGPRVSFGATWERLHEAFVADPRLTGAALL
jgi:hypothetical protein